MSIFRRKPRYQHAEFESSMNMPRYGGYCPVCKEPMDSRRILERGDDAVVYQCANCRTISKVHYEPRPKTHNDHTMKIRLDEYPDKDTFSFECRCCGGIVTMKDFYCGSYGDYDWNYGFRCPYCGQRYEVRYKSPDRPVYVNKKEDDDGLIDGIIMLNAGYWLGKL